MNKPWTMTAKAAGELQVTIYEQIGEDFWSSGEGLTAKTFASDLKAAGNVRRIKLLLNCAGGSVWDGLGIFDTLVAHPANVSAEVRGLCASIASVILMSADPGQIAMTATSTLMLHNPSTLIAGDSNEMRKMAAVLDKVKSSMIASYRRHSSKSVAEIGAIMDAESWYSPAEAIAAGFVDKIATPDDEDEYQDESLAAAVRTPIFARFRHPPAHVRQIAARCSGAGDDGTEWRRRRNRQRTLEMHEMWIMQDRRDTLALHELQIRNMQARADLSEAERYAIADHRRRRILAERAEELRAWNEANFVWEDVYVDGAYPKTCRDQRQHRSRPAQKNRGAESRAWPDKTADLRDLDSHVVMPLCRGRVGGVTTTFGNPRLAGGSECNRLFLTVRYRNEKLKIRFWTTPTR